MIGGDDEHEEQKAGEHLQVPEEEHFALAEDDSSKNNSDG